jgi:hypothetical protein
VIPPRVFDAASDYGVLQPLRFVAQIRSGEPFSDDDHGSWMNLIWFAEVDDEKSIKAFVEDVLRQVDWKGQAEGYEIQGRTWWRRDDRVGDAERSSAGQLRREVLSSRGHGVIREATIEVVEQGAGQGALATVAREFDELEEVFACEGPEVGVGVQA